MYDFTDHHNEVMLSFKIQEFDFRYNPKEHVET